MNLLLRYIFYGIMGYLNLIHLDLAYANHIISLEKYIEATNDANKTIDCALTKISGDE